jgi:predicted DNA-binding transcriptional regulator AlpA
VIDHQPTGGIPSDELAVPVRELAELGGCTRSHFYRLIREGRAPALSRDPELKGVPMAAAVEWLRSRNAKKAARAVAVRRLRELIGVGAKEDTR